MINNNEAETIGATLTDLQKKVIMRDRLNRLEVNRDFKALVLEGYFKDKPVELSRVAAQVTLDEKSKQVWDNAQIGISAFQSHLHGIYSEGNSAELAIAEYNEEAASDLGE